MICCDLQFLGRPKFYGDSPRGTRPRLFRDPKEKERKVHGFYVQLKAYKIRLVYHTNQTKKDEKSETKIDERLSPEMVLKIREIREKM